MASHGLDLTLFSLCGRSLEKMLTEISRDFVADERISHVQYSIQIERFTRQLCEIPPSCHDALAENCLKACHRFVGKNRTTLTKESVLRTEFVIQRLVSIVSQLKIRELNFRKWRKPVREHLLNFLWRMSHLQDLLCSTRMKLDSVEPRLLDSLPFLTELIEFYSDNCTDKIIATLCENCPRLKVVSTGLLRALPQVTDKSIDSLIQCQNLERVSLKRTKITLKGKVKLLLQSQSNNFKSMSDDSWCSNDFLDLLENCSRSFQLHEVMGTDIDGRHLPLISKYFPNIVELSLDYYEAELADFSCFDRLQRVRDFELSVCKRPAKAEPLYSLKSQLLTSLHISCDLCISITGLMNIGMQCPNLTMLSLHSCSLRKDVDELTACSFVNPFHKLSELMFDSDSTVSGLELILMHATNITDISLEASSGLTDEFLANIFKFNMLNELTDLTIYGKNNITVEMWKYIILRCEKIKELGDFTSSDDDDDDDDDVSALEKEKFNSLQVFITEHNLNVRLS